MVSRNLSDRTKEMLIGWCVGDFSNFSKDSLIFILIDELSPTKRKQAEKIKEKYYK